MSDDERNEVSEVLRGHLARKIQLARGKAYRAGTYEPPEIKIQPAKLVARAVLKAKENREKARAK
jgi:hypothetical protein